MVGLLKQDHLLRIRRAKLRVNAISVVLLSLFSWPAMTSNLDNVVIPDRKLAADPFYKSRFRYDNNERNTSAAYDLWNQAGYFMFEWPGNITIMDPEFPLLKWSKSRARMLRSPCEVERGMELAVYSYKYLHLTWGANRLTSAYCQPLRVARKSLPEEYRTLKDFELPVEDYAFVFDAFLVVTSDGYVIRFGDIEKNYGRTMKRVRGNLTHKISTGITTKVNRLVGQSCCSKSKGICPHGDAVVAFHDNYKHFMIFISEDRGYTFRELKLKSSPESSILRSVLFYPNWNKLLTIYENKTVFNMKEFNSTDGNLFSGRTFPSFHHDGFVQAQRIGNDMNFLAWDDCRIWYFSWGVNEVKMTPASFYLHSSIIQEIEGGTNKSASTPHSVRSRYCHLGKSSRMTNGEEGKLGILGDKNIFLYGVDLKEDTDFRVVALSTDLTLLLPHKRNTVVPHFDRNNRPKIMYPPRYLQLPNPDIMNENYRKRKGMKLLPKTLFPSDFIRPFYEENAGKYIPQDKNNMLFGRCRTSSLSVDGSISQKRKLYTINQKFPLDFTISFTKYRLGDSLNDDGDPRSRVTLHMEPKLIKEIFNVHLRRVQAEVIGDNHVWMKFNVSISVKKTLKWLPDKEIFLVNFYTVKALRCVHQPQVAVWIHLDEDYVKKPKKAPVKAKSNTEPPLKLAEASKTFRVDTCPLSCKRDQEKHGVCQNARTMEVHS